MTSGPEHRAGGEGMRAKTWLFALRNSSAMWELRRTPLWHSYQRFVRGVAPRDTGSAFYAELIDASDDGCILDIGANIGSKTELFRALASRAVAVEPDPDLVRTLRNRFMFRSGVEVVGCAVTDHPDVVQLKKFDGYEAYNTVSSAWVDALTAGEGSHAGPRLPKPRIVEVEGRTLASLEQQFRPVKYIKIDAEGLEYEIVSTLTQPVPLISLEFNLPLFRRALERSIECLKRIDGRYHFNVTLSEPPTGFAFERWLDADQALEAIDAGGWRYIEVFARLEGAVKSAESK